MNPAGRAFSFRRPCRNGGLIWGGDWGNDTIVHSFVDADHVQRVNVADQAKLFDLSWYRMPITGHCPGAATRAGRSARSIMGQGKCDDGLQESRGLLTRSSRRRWKRSAQTLQAATELLLGTAMQESGLVFRNSSAAAHPADCFRWNRRLTTISGPFPQIPRRAGRQGPPISRRPRVDAEELIDNDRYAAAMARIQYYRMGQIVGKDPVPDATDIAGMADYWKTYYNTAGGAGAPAQFVANWEAHHGPIA